MSADQLTAYYLQQGKGDAGSDPVFKASYLKQRGYGLFTDLWRVAKPFVFAGAKALGNQALTTGEQIITDLAHNTGAVPPKEIAKQRLVEAGRSVARKAGAALQDMAGKGRKRRAAPKKQLGAGKRRKPAAKKRKPMTGRGVKQKGGGGVKRRTAAGSRLNRVRTCGNFTDIFA